MSTLETNLVQPATGTTLTLGASGDTVDVPSGATLDVTGATVTGLSAGKVLQVVNATVNTETVINNNTWTDTGITLAITPSSSSSKVLVQANAAGCGKATNNTYLELKLLRGTTDLIVIEQRGGYTADTAANKIGSCSCTYLDSPSTTSATTYKLQGRSGANNAYAQVGDSNPYSTITLMEISA